MKDPSLTEDWVDSLAARLRLDDGRPPPPRRAPRRMAGSPFAKGKGSSLMAEYENTRASTRGLTQLRELSPTSTLLLFTPVMVPSGYVSDPPSGDDESSVDAKPAGSPRFRPNSGDPFEMLGIALSKQHRRVRHVPYVPSVGFTETHEVFLAKADAVIVVSCEPESSPNMETTLAKQAEFVGNVASELEEAGRQVPLVNFNFGGDEWENQVATYNHVWVGEKYNAETVTNIVKLVFR